MRFNVTKTDIKMANEMKFKKNVVFYDPTSSCPIYQSVTRTLKKKTDCNFKVGAEKFFIELNNKIIKTNTPHMVNFIDDYDNDLDVEPFSFSIPDEVILPILEKCR